MLNDMVVGREIELSEGRRVFMAREGDLYYVRFKNSEGVVTKITLSPEAMEALLHLEQFTPTLTEDFLDVREKSYPRAEKKWAWEPVSPNLGE